MIELPPELLSYKRTPTFTEDTVPAGLLRDHSTKEGMWGLIRVEEKRLLYVITDPRHPATESILTVTDQPGAVEPAVLHRVESQGSVRFHVEFYRSP